LTAKLPIVSAREVIKAFSKICEETRERKEELCAGLRSIESDLIGELILLDNKTVA
jgi:hypothetical protein